MTPAVYNERVKLSAAFLSTLASATITAGIIAPLAAATFGVAAPPFGIAWSTTIVGFIGWFFAGVTLHILARFFLTRMRPT